MERGRAAQEEKEENNEQTEEPDRWCGKLGGEVGGVAQ